VRVNLLSHFTLLAICSSSRSSAAAVAACAAAAAACAITVNSGKTDAERALLGLRAGELYAWPVTGSELSELLRRGTVFRSVVYCALKALNL
jgi:hypothetical protein